MNCVKRNWILVEINIDCENNKGVHKKYIHYIGKERERISGSERNFQRIGKYIVKEIKMYGIALSLTD